MPTSLRMKQWMETSFTNFRYVLISREYDVTLPGFYIANTYSKYFLKYVVNIYYSFCTEIALRFFSIFYSSFYAQTGFCCWELSYIMGFR